MDNYTEHGYGLGYDLRPDGKLVLWRIGLLFGGGGGYRLQILNCSVLILLCSGIKERAFISMAAPEATVAINFPGGRRGGDV